MSRRKLALRKPCGRLKEARDTQLAAPTKIRRLLDSALESVQDAAWGSQLGRNLFTGGISSTEFAAGKRFAALAAENSEAQRSPRPPKTVLLDAVGGPSNDSESSESEICRHEHVSAVYLEARDVLRLAGRGVERAVDHVVVQDLAAGGYEEMTALRDGLSALALCWTTKRRAAR